MKSVFQNNYWFDTVTYIELVDLRIKTNNEVIQIFFRKDKIAPSSVRIFVLWLTVPSLLLIFIALIFLKNQRKTGVIYSQDLERSAPPPLIIYYLTPKKCPLVLSFGNAKTRRPR